MSSDKRDLHRIPDRLTKMMSAHVSVDGENYVFPIKDSNSKGTAIHVTETYLAKHGNLKNLNKVRIYFGRKSLGEWRDASVVRTDISEKILVVNSIREKVGQKLVEREGRFSIQEHQVGILTGRDPIRFNEIVSFKVREISMSGLKIVSSKANRHLLVGTQIPKMTITIPTLGSAEVGIEIRNIVVDGDRMFIGASFLKKKQSFINLQFKYLLMTARRDQLGSILKNISKKHFKFEDSLKIEQALSENDWKSVAKLRYAAYGKAGKLKGDQAEEELVDSYDKSSIVLLAKLGPHVVGTVRLNMPTSTALPSEKSFGSEWLITHRWRKEDVAEVSRLAVMPELQGTDLVLRLFQAFAIFGMASQVPYYICSATPKLAPYYKAMGAQKIAGPVPHPVVPDEVLDLYCFEKEKFVNGKMAAVSWKMLGYKTVEFLHEMGLENKPIFGLVHMIRLPFELVLMKSVKVIKLFKKTKPKELTSEQRKVS